MGKNDGPKGIATDGWHERPTRYDETVPEFGRRRTRRERGLRRTSILIKWTKLSRTKLEGLRNQFQACSIREKAIFGIHEIHQLLKSSNLFILTVHSLCLKG